MARRRTWIVGVACLAVGAVAVPAGVAGAAGPRAVSSTTASTSTPPSTPTSAPAGTRFVRAHGLSPQTALVAPLTASSGVTCYSFDTGDGTGDTTGGLDGTHYQLSYDCVHKTWTATVTTAQAFSNSQLGSFEIDFDTDNNFSDNCHGVDLAVVVGYIPEAGGIGTDAVRFAGDCGGIGLATPYARRFSAHSISLSWPDWWGITPVPQSFRSIGWLTGLQVPTQNSDFDRLPNVAMLQSQRSTSKAFSVRAGTAVSSSYTQVVGGDFNGDGIADVLFYGAGGAPDYLWLGKSGGFNSSSIAIWGKYTLIPGDFDGDGVTDLLLYAPGTAPDAIWYGSSAGTFTSKPITINGMYTIVSSDFNGDHRDDLFFYAPGTTSEFVWSGQTNRTFVRVAAPAVNNSYRLAAGDFNGDGYGDVLLYAPGGAPDHVLQGRPSGFTTTLLPIDGTYSAMRVGDFDGDTLDDVLFWNPGTGADALYRGSAASPDLVADPGTTTIDENYAAAVVGDFDRNGTDDVYFVAPGAIPETVWYGVRTLPTTLEAHTFGAIAVDPASGRVFVTSGEHGTTMSVLDRHAKKLKTITGLSGPTGVAFGPSTVYVAMTNGHTIATFDRATVNATGTIDTGLTRIKPMSVAYQHGKLWFTYAAGLGVWDPATNTVSTAATDIHQSPVLASGTDNTDTLVMFPQGDPMDIARYDISTGSAVLAQFRSGMTDDPGGNCLDVTLSPDHANLWVACADPYHVVELDTATLAPTGVEYDAAPYPDSVVATGLRGGWVVGGIVGWYSNDVFVHRIGKSTTVRSFELGTTLYQRALAMSPDGRIVYAASHIEYPTSGPTEVSALPMP